MKSTMQLLSLALFVSYVIAADAHGEDAKKEMGPVAFMWPEDRPWTAYDDNTPPCGTSSGPVNRTDFPRTNGAIALVVQDEAYNISVSVAYGDNPVATSNWNTQFSKQETEIKPGHICYSLPSLNLEGTNQVINATIQIKYTSDFNTNRNETFYACADIRYVPTTSFKVQIPCFNVTSEEFVPATNQTATPSGGSNANGALRIGDGFAGISVALLAVMVGTVVPGLF